ncbi:MAG: polymer-forming cytoskeletal protein [Acidobacteriota bacterium]|nr:polymer-forming cytoskeletal protein [Acidobacteriota bacterium]
MGDLSGDEEVVVNGRFEGTLRAERRITVGTEAEISGQVHAREVVIFGRVRGDVHAAERAELKSTCTIEGNVHAPKIVIAEGARLEGKVAMSEKKDAGPAPGPSAGGSPGPR